MDNKLNFKKLGQRKKVESATPTPTKIYQEVQQPPAQDVVPNKHQKEKTKAKVGRKSWKKPGTIYTRLGFDTPIETKQKLKQLLAGKFYGKYSSQDEMLNEAIKDFISKHLK